MMSTANKKAPGRNPEALDNTIESYVTSPKGRRAIFHLWTASRAVAGASLTPDDKALIREALSEIAEVLG
jgi:hypothetical protein